jgi:hypothetical protein
MAAKEIFLARTINGGGIGTAAGLTAGLLAAFLMALAGEAAAEKPQYSKELQNACIADYKKYCGEYGLETSALRTCMDKNGNSLSKVCVQALVSAGEVSQAEVDRRKAK